MKTKPNFYKYGVLFILTILVFIFGNIYKLELKWFDFILLYFIGTSLGIMLYTIINKEKKHFEVLPFQMLINIFKKNPNNISFEFIFLKKQIITFFYILTICFLASFVYNGINQASELTGFLFIILTSLMCIDITKRLLDMGYFYHQFIYKIYFFIILLLIIPLEKYLVNNIYWYEYYGTSIYFSIFFLVILLKRIPNIIEIIAINIMNHFNAAMQVTLELNTNNIKINHIFELSAIISQVYYVRNNPNLINTFIVISNNYNKENDITIEKLTEFIEVIESLIFEEEGYPEHEIDDQINKNSKKIAEIVEKEINNLPPTLIYNAVVHFIKKNPNWIKGDYNYFN